MGSHNTPMGGDLDWNDPMFNSVQFDEQMNADSPFGVNAFNDFTNMDYADSPGLAIRTPSRAVDYGSFSAVPAGAQNGQQQNRTQPSSTSVESSPQDSTSDTSSQHKRKTTESPISDPVAESGYSGGMVKQEQGDMDMDGMHRVQNYESNFDQNFSRPMHNLSLEQNMSNPNFDFNSAASSPAHQRKPIDTGINMDTKLKFSARNAPQQYSNGSPVRTRCTMRQSLNDPARMRS